MAFVFNRRKRSNGSWQWHNLLPGGQNDTVQPLPPPVANFAFNATNDPEVVFTDLSTSSGTIVSWLWNFGDSTTSTSQNPTHTFDTDNNYNVKLTIIDSNGQSAEYIRVVAISGNVDVPVANFDYDNTDDPTIEFTDTSTSGVAITGWMWDFGDSTTSILENPSHVYAANGNYNVILITSNSAGMSTPYQEVVAVAGHVLPSANFTFDDTDDPEIAFTDTSTGGTITDWEWDFGDGGTSTLQNPTYEYTANGTYTVKLIVTNISGTDEIEQDVVIAGVANPLIANAGSDYTYQLEDYDVLKSYTLTSAGSTIPMSSTVTREWKWNGEVIGTGTTKTVRLLEGTYTFELTITETNGLLRTSSDTVVVTIQEAPSIIFYRTHFFKPTNEFTNTEASSHFDDWILTKNDESAWTTIAGAGSADEMHLQYLSFDNLHDPNGDLLDSIGTGAGPETPNNNNAAWINGDIPDLRDASWNGTYADYFLRNPANTTYINKGDQNEYWHVDLQVEDIRDFIISRVVAWSLANKYNGVWYDNLNTSFRRSSANFAPTLQYGSVDDETWMNAAIVMLQDTKNKYLDDGPSSTDGILTPIVGGNLQGGTDALSNMYRWRKMARYLDTIMGEFIFIENGGSYKTVSRWLTDLDKIRYALAQGSYYLAVAPFDAEAATTPSDPNYAAEHDKLMFSLCSMMLVAGNRMTFRGGGQSSYDFEIDPPEYTTFRGYGVPEGAMTYNSGTGYYTREWTKATISVNPTTHAYVVTPKSHTGGFKPYITQPYERVNTVGDVGTYRIYATSPQAADPCTFSMVGAPPGATINANTGVISYNLTSTLQDKFDPVISVTNSIGTQDVTFRWDVKQGRVLARIQCGGPLSSDYDAIDEDNMDDRAEQWQHNAFATLNGATNSNGSTVTAHSSVPQWFPTSTIGTNFLFDAAAGGNLTFNITGLPAGQKIVNVYFMENASTTRQFQLWNGASNQLLNAYNIYAAAGNNLNVVVRERFIISPTSGTINLELKPTPNTSRITAIEVLEYN